MPVEPGKWYLTVGCQCGQWFAFGDSNGPTVRVTLADRIELTCPTCGTAAVYRPEHVRHARTSSPPPSAAA